MIIREMQCKLATWANEDKAKRFDRLLRLIANQDWLIEATLITMASSGANTLGVDGMTKTSLDGHELSLINSIQEQLLNGDYQPQPARRVYIPKANGKMRPLDIPTLRDRIVQRAMLMAMEPIWESDFHQLSYGFRPERSVHHAIRTVKLQLEDNNYTRGRWVIEGDLSSYFDTVHHKLLMKCIRRRIRDKRFLTLLWRFMKAGHIDKQIFCAASEGVPQGGVASPLLANIMLHEFDMYLEEQYLSPKARKDRWYWNRTITGKRPIAERENRQWKPAVAYCRYADDFVVMVKGTKAQAEAIKEECREFLEGKLKLTLNREKTHVTHVNDGFVFPGHRIIRKRNRKGEMRLSTSIPKEKARNFMARLTKSLSENYSKSKIDRVDSINRKLRGWANFYQFTDNTAMIYNKIDRVVFWKLGHWLTRKYRCSMKSIMQKWIKRPETGKAKTWVSFGKTLFHSF